MKKTDFATVTFDEVAKIAAANTPVVVVADGNAMNAAAAAAADAAKKAADTAQAALNFIPGMSNLTGKIEHVIIDCRKTELFEKGSIPSAVNIPRTELFNEHVPKKLVEVI